MCECVGEVEGRLVDGGEGADGGGVDEEGRKRKDLPETFISRHLVHSSQVSDPPRALLRS